MALNKRNRFAFLAKKEDMDPATPKTNRFEALVNKEKLNPGTSTLLEILGIPYGKKGEGEEENKGNFGSGIKPAESKDVAENMDRKG